MSPRTAIINSIPIRLSFPIIPSAFSPGGGGGQRRKCETEICLSIRWRARHRLLCCRRAPRDAEFRLETPVQLRTDLCPMSGGALARTPSFPSDFCARFLTGHGDIEAPTRTDSPDKWRRVVYARRFPRGTFVAQSFTLSTARRTACAINHRTLVKRGAPGAAVRGRSGHVSPAATRNETGAPGTPDPRR